jgi:hypothetical protein
MTDQLPAVFLPGALIAPTDTYIVPALIAVLGDQASWRYVEFFTANINNGHTRRAYARACGRFFAWCEQRGLTLTAIRPFDVAAWVKNLQEKHGAPGVKQQLAAVRRLFDWLVTGQVVPMKGRASEWNGVLSQATVRNFRHSQAHFRRIQFVHFQWDTDRKSPARKMRTFATCFARSSGLGPISDRSSVRRLISLIKISYGSTPFHSDARPLKPGAMACG